MSRNAPRWHRLRDHLEALAASDVDHATDRVGAVLVLLDDTDDDLTFVLTRRRDDLPTHPGQVSFAGGRREAGESTRAAALREAAEEIGLRPGSVEIVGRLPVFYIPPSRFWMAPVVARWQHPHALRAQESEVAAIVRAPLSVLTTDDRWRKIRLSVTGWSWAWQLDDDALLWGATGVVVAMLLDVIEPGWRRGLQPGDLPDELEAKPWLDPALARRVQAARLPGTATLPRGGVGMPGRPVASRVRAAGRAVADAARRLHEDLRTAAVLIGPGLTGAIGRESARALRAAGVDVVTFGVDRAAAAPTTPPFTGTLPEAQLFIDALVGGGQEGRLRGTALEMILALRARAAPIVAIDVPSGLHPTQGLIGDAVAATVTIAIDGMWPALDHAGLAPFVGDLYLWRPGDDQVTRLVGGPERTATGGWRE
jgi:NAD(P)H-hydrate repair Nnr-like enzyme with NAD(P)H-hydrate epimerase domain/8-oxo-dGTP pyrophosphatase MutT (NUDIX family)